MIHGVQRSRQFVAFVLVCSLRLVVAGETPRPSPVSGSPIDLSDGLSPREAVSLALRQNPALLALRQTREIAVAGISQARALSNPELRVGWTDLDEGWIAPRNNDYDLAVRWSPPRPGERHLKSDGATGKVSEAVGQIAEAEQRLAADILFLHTKIIFLDEQIALAETAVKLRERMVEFVEGQVKAEVKSLLDLNMAELALADIRLLPGAYRTERLLCRSRLASELNLPYSVDMKMQPEGDPLVLKTRPLDVPGLIDKALVNRAEFAVAAARSSQAQAMLSLKRKERYPWFSFLQFGRQFEHGSASDSWGFRFGIDLPISKWNRESIQAPSAEMERCRLEYENLKRRISLEVEQLVVQLLARYGTLEHFSRTMDTVAGRNLELSEQAVILGQEDRLLYLMAEARQLQRKQNYLADLLDCRRLEIELDRATGSVITH